MVNTSDYAIFLKPFIAVKKVFFGRANSTDLKDYRNFLTSFDFNDKKK